MHFALLTQSFQRKTEKWCVLSMDTEYCIMQLWEWIEHFVTWNTSWIVILWNVCLETSIHVVIPIDKSITYCQFISSRWTHLNTVNSKSLWYLLFLPCFAFENVTEWHLDYQAKTTTIRSYSLIHQVSYSFDNIYSFFCLRIPRWSYWPLLYYLWLFFPVCRVRMAFWSWMIRTSMRWLVSIKWCS